MLIAIWGSSGAGKTVFTMALAAALSKQRKDILVLSADGTTPSLPVLLPSVKSLNSGDSIGPLLRTEQFTEQSFKGKILRHPKSDHVFVMGMARGEIGTLTYGAPRRESVRALLSRLQQMPFHHLLVDCSSNLLTDPVTLTAMEWADKGFCVVSPDVKGYEFYRAHNGWLENSDSFRMERFSLVANMVLPITPIGEAQALFGGFDAKLPWSLGVNGKFIAGELLTGFDDRPGIDFARQVELLAKKMEESDE